MITRWFGEHEDPDRPGLAGSLVALSLVNFFMADLQSGLGPFLGVALVNQPGWNPATIGLEMTLGSGIGLLVQAPTGAWIDATRYKRALLAVAALLTSVGTALVATGTGVVAVTAAQILTGLGGVLLGPLVAAIALGMVGPAAYTARTGRMAAFNHAGNVVGSVVVGGVGFLVSLRTGFWIASLTGVLVVVVSALIKPSLIDDDVARGLTPRDDGRDRPSGLRILLRNRPLLVLALVTGMWQLANGAMLPLTGQELAVGDTGTGALSQAALTVVAQLVMIPMAVLVARRGDRWGRKPLYLVAFVVLPVRGLLFAAFSAHAGELIASQVLDGIGAGIQGTLFAIMVADLTRGTGRFNVAFGAATVVQGLGATFSTGLGGVVRAATSYSVTMLVLTGVAVVALVLLVVGVPETAARDPGPERRPDEPVAAGP